MIWQAPLVAIRRKSSWKAEVDQIWNPAHAVVDMRVTRDAMLQKRRIVNSPEDRPLDALTCEESIRSTAVDFCEGQVSLHFREMTLTATIDIPRTQNWNAIKVISSRFVLCKLSTLSKKTDDAV